MTVIFYLQESIGQTKPIAEGTVTAHFNKYKLILVSKAAISIDLRPTWTIDNLESFVGGFLVNALLIIADHIYTATVRVYRGKI
jgi:hypothetical protein